MSDSRARSLLKTKGKYSVKTVTYEMFTTDYDPKERYLNGHPYDGWLEDVWVFARTDRIHWAKLVHLELLKRKYDDRSLYWGPEFEKITYSYNVGSYEMKSKFENVTGHAALSDNTPDDYRTNDYEGTVYWTYHKVNVDGTTQVKGVEKSSDYEFKSYEPDSSWVEDLCKNHQTLSVYPNINNSARRRFENKGIYERRRRYGGTSPSAPYIPGRSNWHNVLVEIERVVVQEED